MPAAEHARAIASRARLCLTGYLPQNPRFAFAGITSTPSSSKRLVGLVGDFKTVVEAKATYRLPVIQELSDQERLKFFDKVCDRLAVELDNQLRRDFEELGIEVMPAKAKRGFWGK